MDVRLVYEADVWMEGLYGIQAARYYLDVHPDARLCVLESEGVVGGVWSSGGYAVPVLFHVRI